MKCEWCHGFGINLCQLCDTVLCDDCDGCGRATIERQTINNPKCAGCHGIGSRMTLNYRGDYVMNLCGSCGGRGSLSYGSFTYDSCLRCFGLKKRPSFLGKRLKKCGSCDNSGYVKCYCVKKYSISIFFGSCHNKLFEKKFYLMTACIVLLFPKVRLFKFALILQSLVFLITDKSKLRKLMYLIVFLICLKKN